MLVSEEFPQWNRAASIKPGSPAWHAELAIFWTQEALSRIDRLRVEQEELEAAQRAMRQHELAAAGDDSEWKNR